MGSTQRFERCPRVRPGKILLLGRRHAAGGLKIAGCCSAFKNDLVAGFVEIDLKDLFLTYFFFIIIIILNYCFKAFFVQGASEIASFYSSHEKEPTGDLMSQHILRAQKRKVSVAGSRIPSTGRHCHQTCAHHWPKP